MILFIDDRPIRLYGPKASTRLGDLGEFDHLIDVRLDLLRAELLHGHLLLLNATPATAEKLLFLLQTADASDLLSTTLVCVDKAAIEERIHTQFRLIKAAGGVVLDEHNRMLLIFRRGMWDLPKGKLEDGESSKQGAVREVEEETGVRVALGEKICTTYHTYSLNDNRILKRTKWYRMQALDSSRMAPQTEEDIERLEFMDRRQAQAALTNSFSSIRYVIESMAGQQ